MADGVPTLIMGVVNVTPDSFSDGGRRLDADAAIAHGLELVADGADALDAGGESTRPGAARNEPEEELRRVVPAVRELAGRGIRVSVDTMRATTALAAVEAGAVIINDVSAGLADAAMALIVAETACTTSPCIGAGTPTAWMASPSTATSPRRCATSCRPVSRRSPRRA